MDKAYPLNDSWRLNQVELTKQEVANGEQLAQHELSWYVEHLRSPVWDSILQKWIELSDLNVVSRGVSGASLA